MLQEPCLQGILFSHYLSSLWLQRAGFIMGFSCGKTIFQALTFFPPRYSVKLKQARLCKKTTFQALKNCFPHWSFETQRSSALQKKTFFRLHFFLRTNLANSYKHGFEKMSGSKKKFFPYCSHETQASPALQKSICQALKNHFFACLLSNLPTPPCYLV